MSLILDALNRSRQESDPVPGLATQHPMEQVSSDKPQLLLWIALAVALALVAWLLLERVGDHRSAPAPAPSAGGIVAPVAEPPKNTVSSAAAVQSLSKSRVQSERNTRAIATAPPVTAVRPSLPPAKDTASDAVAQLYKQRDNGAASAARQAAAKSAAAPQSAAVAPPAPSQAGREDRAQASVKTSAVAQREEEQVDLEDMLELARDEMENSGLVEHPAPFIVSLSQNTKDSIPTVLYQRHDYSTQGGRSSVVLNGKSLRVGGSPAAGLKVDEILSDSVVLSYRGSQFRLRALNSWVNL